jgi:hypothetical protein
MEGDAALILDEQDPVRHAHGCRQVALGPGEEGLFEVIRRAELEQGGRCMIRHPVAPV